MAWNVRREADFVEYTKLIGYPLRHLTVRTKRAGKYELISEIRVEDGESSFRDNESRYFAFEYGHEGPRLTAASKTDTVLDPRLSAYYAELALQRPSLAFNFQECLNLLKNLPVF